MKIIAVLILHVASVVAQAASSDRVLAVATPDASLAVVMTNWAYERDRVIIGVMLAPAALNRGELRGYGLHIARGPISAAMLERQYTKGVEETEMFRDRIARIPVRRDELANAYLTVHFRPAQSDAEPVVYCIPLALLEQAFRASAPPVTVAPPSDAQLADNSWSEAFAPMIELPRM